MASTFWRHDMTDPRCQMHHNWKHMQLTSRWCRGYAPPERSYSRIVLGCLAIIIVIACAARWMP
jgi:hypothetical protein